MDNIDTVIEKVKPIFDAVATKIGQGSEFVWGVLIKQQFVEGISDFVIAGVMLIGVVIAAYIAYKFAKNAKIHDDADYYAGTAVSLIVGGFLLAGSTQFTVDGIKHTVNPAYYALEFLMGLTK